MEIWKGSNQLFFAEWKYPGGEVGVRLDDTPKYWMDQSHHPHRIIARIRSSDDFFRLAMAVDAIRRKDRYNAKIELVLPYLPYARQDRVCNAGESLSIAVFAKLVNSLKVDRVWGFDLHSHVAEALFDNFRCFSQLEIIAKNLEFSNRVNGKVVLAIPDAGAEKKSLEVAKYFGLDTIQCRKVREQKTGNILGVHVESMSQGECKLPILIVDDICDGGRTFIELAGVLKKKGAEKIILYVTHGIFSKGIDVILKGGIDEIWTTDSFQIHSDSRVNTFRIPYNTMIEDKTL